MKGDGRGFLVACRLLCIDMSLPADRRSFPQVCPPIYYSSRSMKPGSRIFYIICLVYTDLILFIADNKSLDNFILAYPWKFEFLWKMSVKNVPQHHSHYIRRNSAVWFNVNIFKWFEEIFTSKYFLQTVLEKSVQLKNFCIKPL